MQYPATIERIIDGDTVIADTYPLSSLDQKAPGKGRKWNWRGGGIKGGGEASRRESGGVKKRTGERPYMDTSARPTRHPRASTGTVPEPCRDASRETIPDHYLADYPQQGQVRPSRKVRKTGAFRLILL